jgi:hypothetical protein
MKNAEHKQTNNNEQNKEKESRPHKRQRNKKQTNERTAQGSPDTRERSAGSDPLRLDYPFDISFFGIFPNQQPRNTTVFPAVFPRTVVFTRLQHIKTPPETTNALHHTNSVLTTPSQAHLV